MFLKKEAAKNAHSCIWSVKWNKWQACVMQGERQTCIISSICNTTCVIFTTKLMTRLNCFSWFYPWKLRYEFIFIFLINGVNDCVFHRVNTADPVSFTLTPPECHMEIRNGYGTSGTRVTGPVHVGDPLTLLILMRSQWGKPNSFLCFFFTINQSRNKPFFKLLLSWN